MLKKATLLGGSPGADPNNLNKDWTSRTEARLLMTQLSDTAALKLYRRVHSLLIVSEVKPRFPSNWGFLCPAAVLRSPSS